MNAFASFEQIDNLAPFFLQFPLPTRGERSKVEHTKWFKCCWNWKVHDNKFFAQQFPRGKISKYFNRICGMLTLIDVNRIESEFLPWNPFLWQQVVSSFNPVAVIYETFHNKSLALANTTNLPDIVCQLIFVTFSSRYMCMCVRVLFLLHLAWKYGLKRCRFFTAKLLTSTPWNDYLLILTSLRFHQFY